MCLVQWQILLRLEGGCWKTQYAVIEMDYLVDSLFRLEAMEFAGEILGFDS